MTNDDVVLEHGSVLGVFLSGPRSVVGEQRLNASHVVISEDHVVKLYPGPFTPLCTAHCVPRDQFPKHSGDIVGRAAFAGPRRQVFLKHPEPVPADRVHGVVDELVGLNGRDLCADRFGERRTVGVSVEAVPKAEMRASGDMVVADGVVRVGDPESGRCDVIVEQTGAGLDEHDQVILQHVSGLDSVLQKDGAAHDVIDHVVLDQDVVRVVEVDGAVECLVDTHPAHVGAGHVAVDVEVDGIAAQTIRLSDIRHLDVFDMRHGFLGVHLGLVQHDLRAVFVASHLLAEPTLETLLLRKHLCKNRWFKMSYDT